MSPAAHDPRSVHVDLGDRSYDVRIGSRLLEGLGTNVARVLGRTPGRAFVIADANVGVHADRAVASMRDHDIAVSTVSIVASERHKSLETLGRVLGAMAEVRLERGDVVVGVGGGITGDLAGFAAACYRRGTPIVQCPTTLLAMVDASVGGKTGVNLEAAGVLQKNMVGAFHQPILVVADLPTLGTLPEREFRSGLAECVKHGLLGGCTGDPAHLDWIVASLDALLARDPERLAELVERSVAVKAAVVAGDELELLAETPGRPSRALLNLGHTFAHAIETLPGLSPTGRSADAPLLHGEAVSLGLVAAAATSAEIGLCPTGLLDEIASVLGRCGLPVNVSGLPDVARLISLMGADKKVADGRLRLVLPEPGRTARLVGGVPTGAIEVGWRAIGAG